MKMVFGYFDSSSDTPAFDPGIVGVHCPHCDGELSRPMTTISFMRDGDSKSYFYRCHKECAILADPEEVQAIESCVVDAREMMKIPSNNN
jgi:hypothetical protein